MRITLRDVAAKTGLSITTVSRALNGYDDVALETKQFIQEMAAALGYTPNLNARRLKTQRADAIGLILPQDSLRFSDPFFSSLFSGIVEQCAQYGLELNVTTALSEKQVGETYIKFIKSNRVDGFILVRVERQDPRIRLLQQYSFPFVAFGRTDQDRDFPFLDEDGEQAVHQLVDHLVSLGHTRIGCITEPSGLAKSFHRLQGYRHGLEAHGIPVDPALIVEGNFRQHSGRLCAQKLLDLASPPTAIVAVNDLLALGAMSALHERGLRVGEDVSITGFDDIALAEYAHPPLTTVHQEANEMGHMLCQIVVRIIRGESTTPEQLLLPAHPVFRQSTGPRKG